METQSNSLLVTKSILLNLANDFQTVVYFTINSLNLSDLKTTHIISYEFKDKNTKANLEFSSLDCMTLGTIKKSTDGSKQLRILLTFDNNGQGKLYKLLTLYFKFGKDKNVKYDIENFCLDEKSSSPSHKFLPVDLSKIASQYSQI